MKLTNKKTRHAVFGEGKIVSQEPQRITVQFSDQYGTKQFVYPDAFDKYLKLYDTDLETGVRDEIHSKQKQMDEEKERLQQIYEDKIASEKLKAATEKKTATKKRKEK